MSKILQQFERDNQRLQPKVCEKSPVKYSTQIFGKKIKPITNEDATYSLLQTLHTKNSFAYFN